MNKHDCQYLRILTVAMATIWAATLRAQVEVEYFIDTDPGMGLAQRTSVSPDAEGNVSFSPSTEGLSPGAHVLGWRALRMNEGKRLYGPTLTHEFYVPRQAEAKVTRVEYFFDTDPGIGQGTPIAITASNELNMTDVEVSTAGLAPGIHQMGFRAFGDQGWGPTMLQEFYVPVKEADLSLLSAEYFIDTDPGFGAGTPISVSTQHEVTFDGLGLSLNGLSQGKHLLGVRYRGTNGWSTTFLSDFFLSEGDGSSVTNAEYFFDTDPGFGHGTPISITAGQEVTVDGLGLSAEGLSQGGHMLGVRYRGGNGWSATYTSNFYLIEGDGTIASAEYFWDTDPGFGQGTPIALTPGEEVTFENLGIPSYEIHGDAVLYIRYRGPQGWSPTLGFAITVEAEGSYTLNATTATDAATRTYQTLSDAVTEFADRGVGADITLNVTTSDTNYTLDATGTEVLAQFSTLGESLGTTTSPRVEKTIAFTAAAGSNNTLAITTTVEGLPTVVNALAHASTENVTLTINGTAYNFAAATGRHEEIFCGETTTAVALSSISTAITATWTAQPHDGIAIGGYQTSGTGDLPAMTLTCTGTKQDSLAYAITLSDGGGTTLCTYTYYIYVQPRVNATDLAALQQLYTDFGGASWNGKKWDTSDALITANNWSGVTFNGSGRVTAIDLSKRGLVGHILRATTLQPMTALTSLKLAYNQIDEVSALLPTTITTLDLGYQHRTYNNNTSFPGLADMQSQSILVGSNGSVQLPSLLTYYHTGQNFNEHPTLKVYTTSYSQVGTLTWTAVNGVYTFAPSNTQVTLAQDADVVLIASGDKCGANSALPATLHFVTGDANLSGLVDVNDVQRTLNYVINSNNTGAFGLWSANTYTTLETETVINIQDIVCTVDIVLDEQNGNLVKAKGDPHRTSSRGGTSDSGFQTSNVFYNDGRSLMLQADEEIAAFDLEIEGVSASQVRLLLNSRDWQMTARNTERGVRLVVFSPTGEKLTGNTELLRLSADAVPTGVQATSPEAKEVVARVHNGVPTGIGSLSQDSSPIERGGTAVYDLSGRKVQHTTTPGVYIINGKKVAK